VYGLAKVYYVFVQSLTSPVEKMARRLSEKPLSYRERGGVRELSQFKPVCLDEFCSLSRRERGQKAFLGAS
jgi:hypothetical protein